MISNMPSSLVSLQLEYCGLPNILPMPFLRLMEIRLQGISCLDATLQSLSSCLQLSSLSVENCPALTGTFLNYISSTLTTLQLNWCDKLNEISSKFSS